MDVRVPWHVADTGNGSKTLTYDSYRAVPSSETCSAVLLVHGGDFEKGSSRDRNLVRLAQDLAVAGFHCFSINYRLMRDNPPAPPPYDQTKIGRAFHAATVDVHEALRFLEENRDTFNLDKIFVVGESAGAVAAIAASVSDTGEFASDQENFLTNIRVKPDAIVSLWGGSPFVFDDFDPQDPPILMIHGMKDNRLGVSFPEALFMVEVCREAGVRVETHFIPGVGHGAWDVLVDKKPLSQIIVEYLKKEEVNGN